MFFVLPLLLPLSIRRRKVSGLCAHQHDFGWICSGRNLLKLEVFVKADE